MRTIRGIITFTMTALLIIGSMLIFTGVSAHGPQSMSIAYDLENGNLTVNISHIVVNPTLHYIEKVDVDINDINVLSQDYPSQPSNDAFSYYYDVAANPGDVINVTATCSVGGSAKETLKVPSDTPEEDSTPPDVKISAPSEGAVLTSNSLEVRGSATDNVEVSLVEAQVNGGIWHTCDGLPFWTVDVTLQEGANVIEVRATDSTGNWAVDYVNVTYDNDGGQQSDDDEPDPGNSDDDSDSDGPGATETDSDRKVPGFTSVIIASGLGIVVIIAVLRRRI